MEKRKKWDNASMEAVENQETALQWLIHDRATLHGLVWNLSSCSVGETGESSGVKDPNARDLGRQEWKVAACPCSTEPSPGVLAQLCLTSGAELLAKTEAQEFFSDM